MPLIRLPQLTCRLFLAGFFIAYALTGCTDSEVKENNVLRKEIISVHDEAMDKIGYMYELESKLKDQLPQITQERKKSFEQAIADLQLANRKMFDWMHQYQTLATNSMISEDNIYRRIQLEKIRTVQELTNEAIAEAEQLLTP